MFVAKVRCRRLQQQLQKNRSNWRRHYEAGETGTREIAKTPGGLPVQSPGFQYCSKRFDVIAPVRRRHSDARSGHEIQKNASKFTNHRGPRRIPSIWLVSCWFLRGYLRGILQVNAFLHLCSQQRHIRVLTKRFLWLFQHQCGLLW